MIDKEQLLKRCKSHVEQRLQTIETILLSNRKALESETKSTAGDKHETGRAHLQIEIEKAGTQLAEVLKMKNTLAKISLKTPSKKAHLGSLVVTNRRSYFLAVSAGNLLLENEQIYAVSLVSPIGKLLLGKEKGDRIVFNGTTLEIIYVQ